MALKPPKARAFLLQIPIFLFFCALQKSVSSISLSHAKTSVDSNKSFTSGASDREDRKNFSSGLEDEDSESNSENLDLNFGFLKNLSNNKGKLSDNDSQKNGPNYGYAKINQKGRILSRTNRNVNVAEPIKKASSPNQQANNDLNDYIMGSLFINNDYHRIFVQRQPINVRPKVDMMSMKPRAYMSTLDFDRYAVGQGGKRYRGSGFFSG